MSYNEKQDQAFNPPIPVSLTGSASSGATWADIGTTYPKLAMTLAKHQTGTREMVLHHPRVFEPRGSSPRLDSGSAIIPLVFGLVLLFFMRRHRC